MVGIASVGSSSVLAYKLVSSQYAQQVAQFSKTDSQYKKLADHFTQAAPTIDSVDALVKDRQLLTVALEAFGLQDQVDAKGLLKKLLTEDPTAKTSLANKLNDPRYQQFAKALQGLQNGTAIFADSKALSSVLTAFQTNAFEVNVGDQNETVREALYFKRNAAGLTTWSQVLSSAPLSKVVRGALGLPEAFGALDPTQQKQYLASHYDLKKLQDPAEIDKLVQRYLAKSDADAAAQATSASVALFTNDASSAGDAILGTLGSGGGSVNLLA